jgi:hypothetical protein
MNFFKNNLLIFIIVLSIFNHLKIISLKIAAKASASQSYSNCKLIKNFFKNGRKLLCYSKQIEEDPQTVGG